MTLRFWGIDPSTTSTGIVGMDEHGKVFRSCVVKSKPLGSRPFDEIVRLRRITKEVMDVIDTLTHADGWAMEGLSFASSMSGHSGLVGLHYLLRDRMENVGIIPAIVQPTSLKKFVGSGAFKKNEMRLEVYKAFGFEAKTDDEVDAYVLAQIARARGGMGKWNQRQQEVINLIKKQV